MANRKDPNVSHSDAYNSGICTHFLVHTAAAGCTLMYGDKMWNNKNEQMKTMATIKAVQCAMQNGFQHPFAFNNFGCSGCFVNWQKLIRKTYDLNKAKESEKKNDNVEQNRGKNSKTEEKKYWSEQRIWYNNASHWCEQKSNSSPGDLFCAAREKCIGLH